MIAARLLTHLWRCGPLPSPRRPLRLLSGLFFALALAPGAAPGQVAVEPGVGHRLQPLEFSDLGGTSHRLDWSAAEPKAA